MLGAIGRSDHGKLASLLELIRLLGRDCTAAELGMCLSGACAKGETECTRLLLAAHAAVDYADVDYGNTSLHLACGQGHSNCAQLLRAARAAVDLANIVGATPLHRACNSGCLDAVKLLLAAHAALDHVSNFELGTWWVDSWSCQV